MKKKKLKKKLKSGDVRVLRINRETISEMLLEYFLENESLLGMKHSKKKKSMHFMKGKSSLGMSKTKKHDIVYSMHWHGSSDELTLMACRGKDYRHIDLKELEENVPLTEDSIFAGQAYQKYRLVRVSDEED